jgi:uncharacterized protein (TIGR03790 family)
MDSKMNDLNKNVQDKSASCKISTSRKKIYNVCILIIIFLCTPKCLSLEPNEVLIIANKDIPQSTEIASYYCLKRGMPQDNILALSLGKNLNDSISRENYRKQIVEPIRREFEKRDLLGKIRCLLTVYGVPFKVGSRGVSEGREEELKELKNLIEKKKEEFEAIKETEKVGTIRYEEAKNQIDQLQLRIDVMSGSQTSASLDSELTMVLFDGYELYRWQPNLLKKGITPNPSSPASADVLQEAKKRLLMVSRLDGPSDKIVKGLIDKAITAETSGLKGNAYFDSRGIVKNDSYGQYDYSLRDLASFTKSETNIPVIQDQNAKLFQAGDCPETALYCGWYSLREYVDAFDFVDGAVGFHIASFEAVNLRDPNSNQWVPAMLMDGITATLGPVTEPYLQAFPDPKAFFTELYDGKCLVEAYYATNPFNSWQLLLIGDPLYKPFKKSPFVSGLSK